MTSPYHDLPGRGFWSKGVSRADPAVMPDLYVKRFDIRKTDRIATAGSCFAQHIGARLLARDFAVIDTEPRDRGMDRSVGLNYGYSTFSARTGNIYTTRQLLQLAREAYGAFTPADIVWRRGERFFDALRPGVEPDGLASPELVRRHRAYHLHKVREVLESADLFIFTFGLTEAWIDSASGTVYPTAPETIAGTFDPAIHSFRNFTYEEVLADFIAFRELARGRNPDMKFLLTVSPVPLTATASGDHVLAATTYSKSVLRAAAGRLRDLFEDVDYFPSYEMIVAPSSRGMFYNETMRTVTKAGVNAVMNMFFRAHDAEPDMQLKKAARVAAPAAAANAADDPVCEDILLDAFGR